MSQDKTPAPQSHLMGNGERIAAAIEACDWSGSPIGNKEILKAAVAELRSLQAWQRGAISCREAEEARIEEYRLAAEAAASPSPQPNVVGGDDGWITNQRNGKLFKRVGPSEGDYDPPCTDCDDTGITKQTERACSCVAGDQHRDPAPQPRVRP